METVMPNTVTGTLAPARRRELEIFGARVARFGVNFAVVTADGRIPVLVNGGRFESRPEPLIEAGRCVLDRIERQRYDGVEIPMFE
ncbi:MAG TPA: hypothetical protein PLS24_03825, partial [Sedimentisphaerales bacterium]|nr:hypothetical protein [Sedimentisphaerales bacterium]